MDSDDIRTAAPLPTEEWNHLDLFRESADELKPALQHQNELCNKWLATKQADDHVMTVATGLVSPVSTRPLFQKESNEY